MLKIVFTALIYLGLSSLTHGQNIKPLILENLSWEQQGLTKEVVHQSLGNPKFSEKNKDHFEIQGLRYPVTVEYREEKVTRIYARYINQKLKLSDLKEDLKNFELQDNKEDKYYYRLLSQDKKVLIKVRRSNDELYSVEKKL